MLAKIQIVSVGYGAAYNGTWLSLRLWGGGEYARLTTFQLRIRLSNKNNNKKQQNKVIKPKNKKSSSRVVE